MGIKRSNFFFIWGIELCTKIHTVLTRLLVDRFYYMVGNSFLLC